MQTDIANETSGEPVIRSLRIEVVHVRNLKRPACATILRAWYDNPTGPVERVIMSYDEFVGIVSQALPAIKRVFLFGSLGEPYINQELENMLASCTANGIPTRLATNGSPVTEE